MEPVSVIIPAYNEEGRIERTLQSLQGENWIKELIVIDDGSDDRTFSLSQKWTNHALRLERNEGKARAIEEGVRYSTSSILLLLDADLEKSAALSKKLVAPLWEREADMTIAVFPPTKNSGYGLVKRFATWGIFTQTGTRLLSPLCGQRAIRKEAFEKCYKGDRGFGIEVGLSLDFLKAGYQIKEIEVPFSHRETGKNIAGFIHRIKQGLFVCHSLFIRR
jgi:GT2 family glycosyltransferase